MNEKELRIGNWVRYNGFNRQIVSLNLGTEAKAEPIELTEEILLKIGFKYSENSYYKYLELCPNKYLVVSRSNVIYLSDCSGLYSWYIEIKEVFFLHQIQNLYFELHNEELQINL